MLMRSWDQSDFRCGATLGATKNEPRKTHHYGREPLAHGRATVLANSERIIRPRRSYRPPRAVVWRKSGPGYRRIAAAAAQPAAAGAMVETAVLTVREDGDNAWGGRKIAKVLQAAK